MSASLTIPYLRQALEEVVCRGALHLDELEFAEWLELTAVDFRYRIQAYSPELRKEMTWLEHDRAGMEALIELLPKHHVNGAEWLRHVVLQSTTPDGDGSARAVSSLAIFHTVVDGGDSHIAGGSSELFAVGRYHDQFRLEAGRWVLADRTVKLKTRQLGIGSHLFP